MKEGTVPPASDSKAYSGDTILGFHDCHLQLPGAQGESFTLDLALRAGELAMLHAEDTLHEAAVTQAACGLLQPLTGSVTFLGRDWRGLSPDWANAARGRIGVTFREAGWLPHLSLLENIILAQLHHTRRPAETVAREAAQWAARFGLPGLPRDLPERVALRDREAANFVRAFLGRPSLIVIEQPTERLPAGFRQTLINAIRDARERGGAVLWLTQDLALSLDKAIPATQRLRLGEGRLAPQEAVA